MGYVRDEKVRFLSVRNGRAWYYLRKWKGSAPGISLGRIDALSRKEAARRCEEISGNLIRTGNPDGVSAASAGNATLGDAWRCYCSQRTVSSPAIRNDLYSGPNPAGMIRKNRETPRRRYLGQDEKRRVLDGITEILKNSEEMVIVTSERR